MPHYYQHMGSQLGLGSSKLNGKPAETTAACHILLQLDHALLVAGRVARLPLERPAQVLVGVVGYEIRSKNAQSLAVLCHLVPVAAHILQILGEVGKAALEDLAVQLGAHDGLEVDVLSPRFLRVGKDEVGCALDGTHEAADAVRVLGHEFLVSNVQDRAEAAASQLRELVDAQHLHIRLGTTLGREPFLKLYHLDILQTNAGINLTADDGFGHVHAATNRSIVLGGHAVVRSQFVNLDLAKLADVADALALEGAKVGGDAGVLQIDHARKRLVEETAN